MLKRIKIVTSLLLVLAVFGLLQLTSGGLFFNALKNDKENFTVLQTIFAGSGNYEYIFSNFIVYFCRFICNNWRKHIPRH